MDVSLPAAHSSQQKGVVYAFCSAGCKTKFDADPQKYLNSAAAPIGEPADFKPLSLIFGGILVLSAAKYFLTKGTGLHDAMSDFMGVFLLTFAGFKLLDLNGFADAYQTYDLVAMKSRTYALAYPFIELALGAAYIFRTQIIAVHGATFLLMVVGGAGVFMALRSGRKIQCACLGTRIKLPMTYVTLLEDALMAVMALGMVMAG